MHLTTTLRYCIRKSYSAQAKIVLRTLSFRYITLTRSYTNHPPTRMPIGPTFSYDEHMMLGRTVLGPMMCMKCGCPCTSCQCGNISLPKVSSMCMPGFNYSTSLPCGARLLPLDTLSTPMSWPSLDHSWTLSPGIGPPTPESARPKNTKQANRQPNKPTVPRQQSDP